MGQRHKLADRPVGFSRARLDSQLRVGAPADRLTRLEHQMRVVLHELQVQFTRLAQLQAEIEATRRAVDSVTQRYHRR